MEAQQTQLGFDDLEEVKQESGPVTCLGMTFANDDERRQYFRDELRKKLPELRQIEGFPIGEDEDIIALSDPPYYTACPNPWLNDFIAEWEKEKVELIKQGKRVKDKVVTVPYASDVSEGKNNPIYMAHTYHTKCPHPAIMRYILHYTEPGDIVFDGFAGTGMTGVAAQACEYIGNESQCKIENEFLKIIGQKPIWGKRHAICGDLSPYASTIAYNYNTETKLKEIKEEGLRILKEVDDECSWMYTTKHNGIPSGKINCLVWSEIVQCPECGAAFSFWDATMDHENKKILDDFLCPRCGCKHTKHSVQRVFETIYDDAVDKVVHTVKYQPIFMVYTVNGKRFTKKVGEDDITLLKKIQETHLSEYYPKEELPKGYNTEQPKRTQGYYYISQFYTKRNLIVLATLLKKIKQSPYANKLLFIFTGIVVRSTQMNRIQINYYFNGGGGWCSAGLKGTLYIPHFPIEISVIEQAYSKLDAFIEASKLLKSTNTNSLYVSSAEQTTINNCSIDYIFTDPPFGSNINYSELNFIPEAWLKVKTNNSTEAIENTSQDKDSNFYFTEMQKCFKEYYRILKPGKWMTVEFSNTKASIWNFIQNSITSVGFIIVNVASLDKKQGSYKSITTPTAVKQDLVITCYKPTEQLSLRFEEDQFAEGNVWAFIEDYLQHLPVAIIHENKSTAVVERSPKILFDRLISYYVQHGYNIPLNAQDFQRGLRERFVERDGMFFTAEQALQYEEQRSKTDSVEVMGILVGSEAEGIEWLKNHLREGAKTYQQLQPEWMQDLVAAKKGDVLPELMTILNENFIKDEDDAWHIPNPEKESDLAAIRNKRLQKEFDLYVAEAAKPKSKIKEVRLEALRYGFKECYRNKDFATIVQVASRIPESLVMEDEVLLQYYDIASTRVG